MLIIHDLTRIVWDAMNKSSFPCVLFSKALQHLSLEALGPVVAERGFDGIDLTARPGGHVEPADIRRLLPVATRTLAAAGAPVVMLTTDLKTPADPHAEATFAAADECGIRYLKLGYIPYTFGQYRPRLEQMRRDAKGFAEMGRRFGVCACHHIHSADFMTQSAFTVEQILQDHDPAHLGAYVDPCHMWIEGMLQNWLMGLEVLGEKVRLVAIKDFRYPSPVKRLERGFEYPPFVPLRHGVVAWEQVMRTLLIDLNYRGPLSFHMEYTALNREQELASAADDLAFLSEILQRIKVG